MDCGAGYGEFAIESSLKGAHKVIAFEPNPTLFEYLTLNTRIFPNIETHQKGVWVANSDSYLYFRKSGTASASISEIQFDPLSAIGKERSRVSISLIDLGYLIDKLSEQNTKSELALKLDIEGAEHKIITYLSETYRLQLLQKVWVEYHYEKQNILELLTSEFKYLNIQHKGTGIGLIYAYR